MSLPPNRNLFADFKGSNRVFVETGTYRGDGIQAALDAGYEKIISIDNDDSAREFCVSRFDLHKGLNADITLHTGDSAERLLEIINPVNEPITFWLDAHWQQLEGTEPGAHPWPLLHELAQIDKHPVKSHMIIIDDILMLTHPDVTGWSLDKIKAHIQMINPAYKFQLVANPVINNILIATV